MNSQIETQSRTYCGVGATVLVMLTIGAPALTTANPRQRAHFPPAAREQECINPRDLKRWLVEGPADRLAPWIQRIEESTNVPGATRRLLAGPEFQALFDACPAIASLARDRTSFREVVAAHPRLVALMGNPVFVSALGSLPEGGK